MISEAYDTLIDPLKRSAYDDYLAIAVKRHAGNPGRSTRKPSSLDMAVSDLNSGIWDMVDLAKKKIAGFGNADRPGDLYDEIVEVLGRVEKGILATEKRCSVYRAAKASALGLENYLALLHLDLTDMMSKYSDYQSAKGLAAILEANRVLRDAIVHLHD